MLQFVKIFTSLHPLKKVSLSPTCRSISSQTERAAAPLSNEAKEEFLAVASQLSQDIMDKVELIGVPELSQHCSDLFKYNREVCEMRSGLSLVQTYKILEKPQNLTVENVKLANIMGWCMQLLGNGFLLADDFMDHTEMRYGAPCWYKKPNVGRSVANDQIFQASCTSILLEKYFFQHPCYITIVNRLSSLIFEMTLGQALDATLTKSTTRDLDRLTMDHFRAMAIRKNSTYCIYTPMCLAMCLAGITNPELQKFAENFCNEIGIYDQILNDYFDCFNDLDVTRKDSSDIQIGKCTWLVVIAMARASAAQKKIMQDYYGSGRPEAEKIIRNLYEELQLPEYFQEFQRESAAKIHGLIGAVPAELPTEMFSTIAKQMLNPYRCLGV